MKRLIHYLSIDNIGVLELLFASYCILSGYSWGIVKGNDADMFGEKVKAYLIRGATRTGGIWPDSARGWGELCVAASLPE